MDAVSTQNAPRWSSYVAIGDSFSEGLWDPSPQDPDRQRGWADRLAEALSARRVAAGETPLEYANLAIRGRLLRPILVDQVPAAIAMKPDLVSLVGGGNDILRPRADIDRLARNLEHGVSRLRAEGIDVLLATGFDAQGSLVGVTRSRVGIYNALIWSIARRHGAHVLDLWGMRGLRDWRMWSSDRIHLVPDAHHRVAQAAMVGLGLEPDDATWDDPLDPLPPSPRIDQVRENAQWLREHVGPWAQRRLRGTSSGDHREPKLPTLAPVLPATGPEESGPEESGHEDATA
ncbi:lysophospholipase L1-like esterase [Sediminihabitans luteus]|uniref:Lysophospholipase L1-like esterase n=1 Tax=Sediminihabitans luteus TaxID=1138585 RepID=A0A2M9CE33_9CELL|nr:SGNH/GDSL hydrolase family protein [Sediminihabitans luteus]PJJ70196.1 lysophospholipase L1-like esterase [Sediminihabitans luteus]GII97667.1 SGNH hydrolase [Sediminihabitans luteus]